MHQPMIQETIRSDAAPAPAGPYSPGLAWGELVFVSGQGPVDPATGEVPEGIAAQVAQTLANLDTLLAAAGSGRDKVLKTQVYLTDLGNFGAMNELYARFFDGCTFPARTTIQAAALPGGIGVEIDAIAYRES